MPGRSPTALLHSGTPHYGWHWCLKRQAMLLIHHTKVFSANKI